MFEGSFVFEMNWYDDRLQWNETEFENIKMIKINAEDIWHPQVKIFGMVGNVDLGLDSRIFILHSDGRVRVLFDHYLSGYCDVHPMYFPFDSHACMFIMQTTDKAHPQEVFRLKYANIVELYHPEWNITGFGAFPGSLTIIGTTEVELLCKLKDIHLWTYFQIKNIQVLSTNFLWVRIIILYDSLSYDIQNWLIL